MQSNLTISTKLSKTGNTLLDHYFVSPPFKLLTLPTRQTECWNTGLKAIQMSSSPGLLAGDELLIHISLAKQTALSLTTQAFTRVQSMNEGQYAEQKTQIKLAEQSRLFYLPHPLVLHKDSALKQTTLIDLAEKSLLIYGEIVAIGRVLNEERFAFRHFSSYLRISHNNKPLLSDRIQWLPAQMQLTALSQMEDFSHQGSLVYINLALAETEIKRLVSDLQAKYSSTEQLMLGFSQLNQGGFIVRTLAHRADVIEQFFIQLANELKVLPE